MLRQCGVTRRRPTLPIVEALYDNDSFAVPVNEYEAWVYNQRILGAKDDLVRVVNAEVEQEPKDAVQPGKITLKMEFNDDRPTMQIPARFWITGNPGDELAVKAVAGSITDEELFRVMLRISWTDSEHNSMEENQYEMGKLENGLYNLAVHHLGDNRTAMMAELQRAAEEFHSLVPMPNESLEATSQNGRITVRLNP